MYVTSRSNTRMTLYHSARILVEVEAMSDNGILYNSEMIIVIRMKMKYVRAHKFD